MNGNLLERGVGWYLKVDEAVQTTRDRDGALVTGNLNWGHVVGFGLGAVYVASPIDLIPDFIPVLGFIDDAAVLNISTNVGGAVWDYFD